MNSDSSVDNLCMCCMNRNNGEGVCQSCGFQEESFQPSPHHLPLRTILNGKYLVGRVLGEGGFGITYLGWDLNLDLKIAIKEFYPTGFVTRENTSTNTVLPFTGEKSQFFQSGREKFVDEAKRLAKFYALPGIVSIKDFFLENGTAYIVMEFVDGQTFKQYLESMGGTIPATQMFDMMKPLMISLSEIHKAGIIHRDISPDNIMISKEGYIKLLDFGAARDFADSGNKSLSVMLKPGYAPEEQYRSKGVQGPWTDVYALCATIYKAITGMTPDESSERIRRDELKKPSQLGIVITPQQETALMKGMSVLQENRFQTVGDLADSLTKAENHEIIPPLREEETPDQLSPVQRIVEVDFISQVNWDTENKRLRDEIKLNFQKWDENEKVAVEPSSVNKGLKKVLLWLSIACLLILLILGITARNNDRKEVLPDATDTMSTEEAKRINEFTAATITIQVFSEDPILEELILEINRQYRNVQVVIETIDYTYYKDYIDKLSLTEDPGDMFIVLTGYDSSLWLTEDLGGSFTELSDLTNLTNLQSLPEEYSNLKSSDGKQYVVPLDAKWGCAITKGSENEEFCKQILNDVYLPTSIFYQSLLEQIEKEKSMFETGTTSGNRANGGYVVQQGEWVYFSLYTKEEGLFKMKTNGSELTKLSDDVCSYMAIEGDWLYYHNCSDSYKLYRMKTDGSQNMKLDDSGFSNYINVVDGYIYYSFSDQGLYKMKIDGSEKTQLTDHTAYHVTVYGDWIFYIYYPSFDENELRKIRKDGSEDTCISLDGVSDVIIVDDWIYYSNSSDKGKIYKMKLDGSSKTCLNQDSSKGINVSTNWIYYVNEADEYSIYKMRTDGSDRMRIRDNLYAELQLVNGELFVVEDWK